MPVELKQVFEGATLTYIREQSGQSVLYKFSGPFQEMNDLRKNTNKNGRIYTKALWEKVFADQNMTERLSSRRMLGELDHPSDDGQIRRTSHIVTELVPDFQNGLINGKLELLNHAQGDAALLRALVEQGVQICVSSRGFGDFLKDGCTIDPESYKLVTFDVVLDPSVSIAKLNQVAEKVNESLAPESKAHLFIEAAKNSESTDNSNNKQESVSMKELIEQIEKTGKLEVALAKNEVHLENMKELVKQKNEAIEKIESASQKTINEAATALKQANEKIATLESTITEYNGIEERAIRVIEGLKAKVEQYESIGERAADTIEELTSRLRQREAGEDDLKKADKAEPTKGPIRDWTPEPKKGADLKQAEAKRRKEEEDDDVEKKDERRRRKEEEEEEDDKDGKPFEKRRKEESDDKDADDVAKDEAKKAKNRGRGGWDHTEESDDKDADDSDVDNFGERKKKHEADDVDADADKKDEADDKDPDAKDEAKKSKKRGRGGWDHTESDDSDSDDEPMSEEEEKLQKEESRKMMRNALKESLIRDGAPKKL